MNDHKETSGHLYLACISYPTTLLGAYLTALEFSSVLKAQRGAMSELLPVPGVLHAQGSAAETGTGSFGCGSLITAGAAGSHQAAQSTALRSCMQRPWNSGALRTLGLFEYLNQLSSGSLCILLLGICYSSWSRSLIPDRIRVGKEILRGECVEAWKHSPA